MSCSLHITPIPAPRPGEECIKTRSITCSKGWVSPYPRENDMDSHSAHPKSSSPLTVLITVAAGGIGRATVSLFAKSGWRIIGVDRSPFGEGFPQDGFFIQSDISIGANLESIFDQAHAHTGYLNALVNNAAGQIAKPIVHTS